MTRSPSRDPDWMGLSEASSLLGVSPATLRRWSDAGRLRVFTNKQDKEARVRARAAAERVLLGDKTDTYVRDLSHGERSNQKSVYRNGAT